MVHNGVVFVTGALMFIYIFSSSLLYWPFASGTVPVIEDSNVNRKDKNSYY